MPRLLAIWLALTAAIACSSPTAPDPHAPIGEEFTLPAGRSIYMDNTTILLRFVRVISDGRCPIDAVCTSAGEAKLEVRAGFSEGNISSATWPTLSTSSRPSFIFLGYEFSLVRLEPDRHAGAEIPAEDYRATFLVTR